MTPKALFVPLLVLFLGGSVVAAEDYMVVVNSSNSLSSIGRQHLSLVFLKKTTSWENGSRIAPVDLSKRSAVRESFTSEVHHKSMAAIEAYWQERIFSGRDTPPIEFSSEAEVLRYVRENPNAIGYVAADTALGSGLRKLTVTD